MYQGKELIFVIDDEQLVLDTLQGFLKYHTDYKVVCFTVVDDLLGHELLPLVDLFVIDIKLKTSKLNGKELCKKLADDQPGVPYLFISGYVEETIVADLVDSIVYDYLEKPFKADALCNRAALLLKVRKLHKQAKLEWRTTFDAIPDLVALISPDWKVLKVNKALLERAGLTREEMVGQPCYQVICKHETPPQECPHLKMLTEGKTEVTIEKFEHALGGDFLTTLSPVYDIDNNLIGSVHVSRDVTDRKKVIQDVWKIFDLSQFYAIVLDNNLNIKLCNRMVAEALGIEKEQLEGQDWRQFIPTHFTRVIEHVHEDITSGSRQYEEFTSEILTKEGPISIKWINSHINTVLNWMFSIGVPLHTNEQDEHDMGTIRQKFEDRLNSDQKELKAVKGSMRDLIRKDDDW